MKKHLLVVGGIREVHDELLELGCEITWFVKKDTVIPGDQHRKCKHIFMFDPLYTTGTIADVAHVLARHSPFDGVCAFHDEAQLLGLDLAEALSLPYLYTRAEIENTRNKFAMREILRSAGLCTMRSAVVHSADDALEFYSITKVKGCIVKPVDGTGSAGVFKPNDSNLEQFNRLTFPVLMEEFFSGVEYSVESFTHEGAHNICAITEKFKTEDGFMERGHLVPARLSTEDESRIADYVKKCLTALGVSAGITHTEIILSGQEVFFVETHTRAAGDQIPKLVNLAKGINLYQLAAMQVSGTPITKKTIYPPLAKLQWASIMYMVQSQGDTPIKSIDNLEELRQKPNVKDVYFRYKVGDTLPGVHHSFDRAASIMVVAESAERALTEAENGLGSIEINFE